MQLRKEFSSLQMVAAAVLTIIAVGAVGCATPAEEDQIQGSIGIKGGRQMDREPLVTYDVSGYGLAGPIQQHLAVYTSGFASYSSLSPGGSSAAIGEVTAERALQLNDDLMVSGALEMGDRWSNVSDLPMTTITIFNGGEPGASYNNFSFYAVDGEDGYQAIVDVINAFIAETFSGQGE